MFLEHQNISTCMVSSSTISDIAVIVDSYTQELNQLMKLNKPKAYNWGFIYEKCNFFNIFPSKICIAVQFFFIILHYITIQFWHTCMVTPLKCTVYTGKQTISSHTFLPQLISPLLLSHSPILFSIDIINTTK